MLAFANCKRRFYSFMEFYVIHLKYQGEKKIDHSTTLNQMCYIASTQDTSKGMLQPNTVNTGV